MRVTELIRCHFVSPRVRGVLYFCFIAMHMQVDYRVVDHRGRNLGYYFGDQDGALNLAYY